LFMGEKRRNECPKGRESVQKVFSTKIYGEKKRFPTLRRTRNNSRFGEDKKLTIKDRVGNPSIKLEQRQKDVGREILQNVGQMNWKDPGGEGRPHGETIRKKGGRKS